jgi:hypothetical protein
MACMTLLVVVPDALTAEELIVDRTTSVCSSAAPPRCYRSIQVAIDSAVSLALAFPGTNYTVIVEPNTYAELITLRSNVGVWGRETTRTILTGGGSGTLMTASNVSNVTIKNFTFSTAATGIAVTNNSTLIISGNVFQMGQNGTAVQVQTSPSTNIINNTFYLNGIGVSRDADITVTNNVFSNNTTAIAHSLQVPTANVSYNFYFNNGNTGIATPDSNSIPNISTPATDPLFVNPTALDFHVREGSVVIGRGNPNYLNKFDPTTSDMGAHGGTNADTIPMPVSILASSPTPTESITLSWSANNSYIVTNASSTLRGSYKAYYSLNRSGPPYDSSTENIASTATTTVITGLTTTSAPPAAPTLSLDGFANQTLLLSWSAVTGATSYRLYYTDNDATTPAVQQVDVGLNNSYALTGLVNNHSYTVTVTAIAQPTYYLSVKAIDYKGHESAFALQEAVVSTGTSTESLHSSPLTNFPEPLVPFPNLPNSRSGCFIATAAYGYYSAPEVQALRDFRDQYLLTSRMGRAFVGWYYEHGPEAAAYLNAHPAYKPVVRAALMPAVGLSLFMTGTSWPLKVFVLILGLGIVALIRHHSLKKQSSGPGGVQ